MRDAESIVLEKSGVLIAARKMKELGISSLFVTKKSGELLGIVTIENVSSMIRQRKEDLETIIDKNIETVGLDASIDEIIPLFLNTKYPVAVLDEDNKLKGIIFKSTILAGIAGEGGTTMQPIARLPLGEYIEIGVKWMTNNLAGFYGNQRGTCKSSGNIRRFYT